MNIAVFLCGQVRELDKSYKTILNTFQNHNVDYYFHFWKNSKSDKFSRSSDSFINVILTCYLLSILISSYLDGVHIHSRSFLKTGISFCQGSSEVAMLYPSSYNIFISSGSNISLPFDS